MVAETKPQIHAYCLHCRKERLMLSAQEAWQDVRNQGTRLTHRGECAECGAGMSVIGYGIAEQPAPIPITELDEPQFIPVSECPRCNGYVHTREVGGWTMQKCLYCGWGTEGLKHPRGKGLSYRLRYIGKSRVLNDKVVAVSVRQRKMALALHPRCPWCNTEMGETSLSGKRRDWSEQRFLCDVGHRISIVTVADELYWK